jgi:hypothetical protein
MDHMQPARPMGTDKQQLLMMLRCACLVLACRWLQKWHGCNLRVHCK